MIFVLTGNNHQLKHKELESIISTHGGSNSFFVMSFDEEQPLNVLQEALRSEDIFGKPLFLKITVEDIKKYIDELKNPLSRFRDSNDVCVVIASSLTKPEKTFFEKYNAVIKEYSIIKKKESPLVFALTDALIRKDKKNAWIIFQRLKNQNVSAEEIHGTLWWQWKTLALVSGKEKVLAKKTISPYVFSKSESAMKLFSQEEVLNNIHMLMSMFQESRRGVSNLFHQLELFILTY